MAEEIDFSDGYAAGYAFAVPACFRSSLERCAFYPGDLFYDNRSAYEKPWAIALAEIRFALQVTQDLVGRVRFAVLVPNVDQSRLICVGASETSSAEFKQLLRSGLHADFKTTLDLRPFSLIASEI